MNPFIFALLSPILYAILNIIDKSLISHKIKNIYVYIGTQGVLYILFGVFFFLVSDWTGVSFKGYLYPIILGIIYGTQALVYFYLITKEDASRVIGLIYVYPIIVALLSYIFLNEKLVIWSYLGMILTIIGGLCLITTKIKASKRTLFFVFLIILITGFVEFLVKVLTTQINNLNLIALDYMSFGLILSLAIFKSKENIIPEFNNIKYYVLLNEIIALSAFICLVFALDSLPATIAVSVFATQPAFTLFFENIVNNRLKIVDETGFQIKKVIGIILVVAGTIIIYTSM